MHKSYTAYRYALTRRRWLGGSISTVALAGIFGLAPARAARLALTPRQGAGPFYPIELPSDHDNDLVRFTGHDADAMGKVTHFMGRVLTQAGEPIAGARVDIWQCDANGRYHHPGDTRGRAPDNDFQGFGRTETDGAGAYHFRTIKPVPYPSRTPHIHFAVWAPGRETFVTQLYIDGEPGNAGDMLYRRIPAEAQPRVTVALVQAPEIEADALAGNFDIVIG